MIRLLSKQEIDKRKAADKKREIDEGVKLAKSVDRLRGIRADEEKSLQDYRARTLALIHGEIQREESRKGELSKEVKELEERRREAVKSLDAERDEVRVLAAEYQRGINEFEQIRDTLNVREAAIVRQEREIQDREVDSKFIHREAKDRLKNAAIMEQVAEDKMRRAEDVLDSASREANRVAAECVEREISLSMREQKLKEGELALVKKNEDYGRKEKALRDRETILERNLKRIKK